MQIRPCLLVVDTEHPGSISTRKLVLETAKYNVITAYSCEEAIAVLERFPRVHGVVISAAVQDEATGRFLDAVAALPELKLIVVGQSPRLRFRREPDAIVDGASPAKLLAVMPRLFPVEATYLHSHEAELEAA